MDQARSVGSGEMLDHVDEGVGEKLSHLGEGVAIDAVAGGSLGDRVSVSGEEGISEEMCSDDHGSNNKELEQGSQDVKGQDMAEPQKIGDELREVDQGTSYNSSDSVNPEVPETETFVALDLSAQSEGVNGGNRKLEEKGNESGLRKLSVKAPKGVSVADKNSCVIDINCGSCKEFCGNREGEMICRICHLASDQPLEATAAGAPNSVANGTGLIVLGCACKDELGIAHSHCAEAWFKIKGNRVCEICGQTAKNVSDITDNRFMEEWNASRFIDGDDTSSRRCGGCWRGQPLCNFLMACLVIAFVLPWFFRVNMF